MKKENDQTSEGLNQIFEIINAKGDAGELNEIVENKDAAANKDAAVNKDQGDIIAF